MIPPSQGPTAVRRFAVYPARAFAVETGAFIGDAIGGLRDVVAGDVFALSRAAVSRELLIADAPRGMIVARGSAAGQEGCSVTPVARHQLMSEYGAMVEIIVVDLCKDYVALPLSPLIAGEQYTLLSSELAAGDELAGASQVSFTRGTCVTMADGQQRPVESVEVGDHILTRDHGPRPVRWIGRQTVRAQGMHAPVIVDRGVLNNAEELVLSPDHRLFIYRRPGLDLVGGTGGYAELLIRVRYLVDGNAIRYGPGGYLDYFHLLFDAHEIIYVACIPAESLLVSPAVIAGFDPSLARDLTSRFGNIRPVPRPGLEPTADDLSGIEPAALLRRSSH